MPSPTNTHTVGYSIHHKGFCRFSILLWIHKSALKCRTLCAMFWSDLDFRHAFEQVYSLLAFIQTLKFWVCDETFALNCFFYSSSENGRFRFWKRSQWYEESHWWQNHPHNPNLLLSTTSAVVSPAKPWSRRCRPSSPAYRSGPGWRRSGCGSWPCCARSPCTGAAFSSVRAPTSFRWRSARSGQRPAVAAASPTGPRPARRCPAACFGRASGTRGLWSGSEGDREKDILHFLHCSERTTHKQDIQ